MVEVNFSQSSDSIVEIVLPLSKSLSNRALILQALYPDQIRIDRLSDSTDTVILTKALRKTSGSVDFGMAGTSVRFFLAYATVKGLAVRIDASGRGRERPIAPIFHSLEILGGKWEFEGEDYSFPCKIKNEPLQGGKTELDMSISSQFATALMLVAPYCPKGIQVDFIGKKTSYSYLEMTVGLMSKVGLKTSVSQTGFSVRGQKALPGSNVLSIEADWSSASFIAQHLVTHGGAAIRMDGLMDNSLQGDRILLEYFRNLGLNHEFGDGFIILSSRDHHRVDEVLSLNFTSCPDLSIPWMSALVDSRLSGKATGLHTLPGKETNRFVALKENLSKIREVIVDDLHFGIEVKGETNILDSIIWETYEDHRFVMAGTVMAKENRKVILSETDSVTKSFPGFQKEFIKLGYSFKKLE